MLGRGPVPYYSLPRHECRGPRPDTKPMIVSYPQTSRHTVSGTLGVLEYLVRAYVFSGSRRLARCLTHISRIFCAFRCSKRQLTNLRHRTIANILEQGHLVWILERKLRSRIPTRAGSVRTP